MLHVNFEGRASTLSEAHLRLRTSSPSWWQVMDTMARNMRCLTAEGRESGAPRCVVVVPKVHATCEDRGRFRLRFSNCGSLRYCEE